MSIIAILSVEHRETITFSGVPDETTRQQLYSLGFRRNQLSGQWYRKNLHTTHVAEQDVYKQFAE